MANVTITVRKNGPYLVSGPVEVRDADGNVYPAKETVALCRCGASTKKPFCDGGWDSNFVAAVRAANRTHIDGVGRFKVVSRPWRCLPR